MTRKAAVIGWPVEQSLSPVIHGYWLEKQGIEGTYDRVSIAPDDLETGIERMMNEGYAGFNVTMPHKQTIMPLLDKIDGVAARIGAVNTVWVDDRGCLHGTNTDAHGFLSHLKTRAGNAWNPEKPALLFGAGGAARAALVALLDAGIPEVRLCNRSQDKAQALADQIGDERITVIDWVEKQQALPGTGLVANTTSLGMLDGPKLDISLDNADRDCIVYDIVYKPLVTPLLADAESCGLKTVDGLGMLMHQAVPGFRMWFGGDPVVDTDLETCVRKAAGC